jgi:hypothetical protein
MERIAWRCPICGLQAHVPATYKCVHCACGWDGLRTRTRTMDRLRICWQCVHYNKMRCSLVDLGCRRTFIDLVAAKDGQCPLEHWPTATHAQ